MKYVIYYADSSRDFFVGINATAKRHKQLYDSALIFGFTNFMTDVGLKHTFPSKKIEEIQVFTI